MNDMISTDQFLTVAGRDRLEGELEELKTVRRHELAGRVAEARELAHGDEADATALVEAQEEQMLLELRIAELERVLAQSETIDAPIVDDGVVRPGCTVTFRDDDGVDAFTLVSHAEANPRAGRISVSSPVGAALVGRRVGEEVVVPTPSGERRLRIEAVE
jgi:transcription elongation factor GreA